MQYFVHERRILILLRVHFVRGTAMMSTRNQLKQIFQGGKEQKLVEFVDRNPALWDANDKEYKNVKLKESLWELLSEHLDINGK